jgi:hypothetical protein
MSERDIRGSVNLVEARNTRYVESDGGLIVPDKNLRKSDLPAIFGGQDIELLVKLKLRELGFTSKDKDENERMRLLENPLVHRYSTGDSPARYFMEIIMGKDAILASYLPPHSITHPHPHSRKYGILEDYHPIGGESILHLNNILHILKASKEVPPDTLHQLEARERPAFTLIIMKNAGLVDRGSWHK